jgi:hypothetical protein
MGSASVYIYSFFSPSILFFLFRHLRSFLSISCIFSRLYYIYGLHVHIRSVSCFLGIPILSCV